MTSSTAIRDQTRASPYVVIK